MEIVCTAGYTACPVCILKTDVLRHLVIDVGKVDKEREARTEDFTNDLSIFLESRTCNHKIRIRISAIWINWRN